MVLNISDLLEDRIDSDRFFEENYITAGMQTLIDKAFERLENRSSQASTFLLAQAMGGGKTHSMIALGLLAKHPELRNRVLGDKVKGSQLGTVKVIGFNGRETDAPFGLWGELADRLNKKEVFNDHYAPLKAPGVAAWINLLQGEPTLIFLDELPPYLENAKTIEIGSSDLSVATATAISNLLVAVDRPELSNVCVVISDLTASWVGGSGQLNRAITNLQNETGRSALRLEPVSSQGSELYHILRTRLFEELPEDLVINEVANAYAKSVKDAKEMDVTNASPDSYAAQLVKSYPFHFSIRDLYARFKENPGFQQTRGLIRLLRAVVANIYDRGQADRRMLVHPYDLDLNNDEILSEVKAINPSLGEAIVHDIAKEGFSVAEQQDNKLGGTDFQDVAKLILVASLANIPNATHGLRESEIVGFLCAPGRDLSTIKKSVIDYLPTQAWYLHRSQDGRLFFKNVQNLAAKLHSLANSYNEQTTLKELRSYLTELFEPKTRDCYQKLEVLPGLDEVSLEIDKVTLIVAEPTRNPHPSSKLSEDWHKFAEDQEFKNRVLFLTGSHETMERIIEQARQYKAILSIKAELDSDRISPRDPQYVEADKSLDQIQLSLRSSLQETFTTLVYPSRNGFRSTDCRIHFQGNYFDGEALIRDTLEKVQKFTTDVASETFRKKCQARLFAGQRTSSWNEVRRRAATQADWNFHHPKALEELKRQLLEQEVWVDEGGVINTQPPPPETTVSIQQISRDDDTGEVTLKIRAINGDVVKYEIGDSEPTTASCSVADAPGGYKAFKTKDLSLKFKCFDPQGKNNQGAAISWKNKIVLKHRVFQNSDEWKVEFKAIPKGEIRYTTDGSDPKSYGGIYDSPFVVPESSRFVLAIAESDGIFSEVEKIDTEQYRKRGAIVDIIQPNLPAIWNCKKQGLTAREAFEFIDQLEKYQGNAYGVSLIVSASDESGEVSYDAAPDNGLNGTKIRKLIEHLQSIFKDGQGSQILIDVDKVILERSQLLKDWFAAMKYQPKPGEVQQ
ncbi:MAG: hypothetical protein N4J56_007111 [Chroococcidiopsis sp. SAG 2025]|nr:hypothetical protein [Chroococcidiopsis sp. SAG 2025]